ncbi:Type II CAAX prenyl endopeptidase Rce1-like protein [Aduncisulcus paluster]|uniref:Type II CAAX prenyl endopeptidase Rce1-like protein n=1 Tax=Aduncisulcus paluster TaxID=2918883 RepID=A0ABQ5K8A4_9EUKA|nr:Type II CAAX prenyl endopeptidase Rce1-like protein [Aduncisulcus paluster]
MISRVSGLVGLILFSGLFTSTVRRSFTDASSFDIPQMWWHSLASAWNIFICIIFSVYVAQIPTKKVGLPQLHKGKANWKPDGMKWVMRLGLSLTISMLTHGITPTMYVAADCCDGFDMPDYSQDSVGNIIYFFALQQFCFIINAADEETSWRGFVNAVWVAEGVFGRWVMYIMSGFVYAGVHTLNMLSSFRDPSYFLMVFNLTCEGAAWMYLYRTTGDLITNWCQHHIDDIFSLWFGGETLAGYALPMGQISPFLINCPNKYISGGDFGTGASFIYIIQNVATVLFILAFDLLVVRRKKFVLKKSHLFA